jgi:SAM-dependent methyltransferase
MGNIWSELHDNYKKQDWIHKPSIFAETAITYFPPTGTILELGAGLGQDSQFFAAHGYHVVSTDLELLTLQQSKEKLTDDIRDKVIFQTIDLREPLPFPEASFEVVYAHLSLHYFDKETTNRIFDDIRHVLKPGGVLAFFVNSVNDPEYNTGERLEEDYFQIDKTAKRYFSAASAKEFVEGFSIELLDEEGETYKDRDKGVHHLVRFVGRMPMAAA